MNNRIIIVTLLGFGISLSALAQVGINTTNPHPSAALHVESTDKGVLFPTVNSSQRDSIALKPDGLILFNTDDNCLNMWSAKAGVWLNLCGNAGAKPAFNASSDLDTRCIEGNGSYNTFRDPITQGNDGDFFGYSLAMSSDGLTMAVGSQKESNNAAQGVYDTASLPADNNSYFGNGAVFVYERTNLNAAWQLNAYIKYGAPTGNFSLYFGMDMALSADGNTLVVMTEESRTSSALVIYRKSGTTWSLQESLLYTNSSFFYRAPQIENNQHSLAISQNGNTIAFGLATDDYNNTGITTSPSGNRNNSGGVYIFDYNGSNWVRQAFIKPSDQTSNQGFFGSDVALSGSGDILAVGEPGSDFGGSNRGRVQIFRRTGNTWSNPLSNEVSIQATNIENGDENGSLVDLSADGQTLAFTAAEESNSKFGVNPLNDDNSSANNNDGAGYIFTLNGSTWTQKAYLKPLSSLTHQSFADRGDGSAMDLSDNGRFVIISDRDANFASTSEDNCINGLVGLGGANDGLVYSYFLNLNDEWKAGDRFVSKEQKSYAGYGHDLSASETGTSICISAPFQDSDLGGGINNTNISPTAHGTIFNFKASN